MLKLAPYENKGGRSEEHRGKIGGDQSPDYSGKKSLFALKRMHDKK